MQHKNWISLNLQCFRPLQSGVYGDRSHLGFFGWPGWVSVSWVLTIEAAVCCYMLSWQKGLVCQDVLSVWLDVLNSAVKIWSFLLFKRQKMSVFCDLFSQHWFFTSDDGLTVDSWRCSMRVNFLFWNGDLKLWKFRKGPRTMTQKGQKVLLIP